MFHSRMEKDVVSHNKTHSNFIYINVLLNIITHEVRCGKHNTILSIDSV